MKNYFIKGLFIFWVSAFFVSCYKPTCENKDGIFDKYLPDSREYKDELVKQLSIIDKSELTYRMDAYQEIDKTRYLCIDIQGKGLCAKMILTIKKSDKGIEKLLKNKGLGYSGAELKNLKFDIKQDSLSTEFIFREINKIVD